MSEKCAADACKPAFPACMGERVRRIAQMQRSFSERYENWACFGKFALVGLSGTVVNLSVVTATLWLQVPFKAAVAAAIIVALFTNFALNRRFTFAYPRNGSWGRQLGGFVVASSLGASANYAVALGSIALWPVLLRLPQAASLAGIAAGLAFNYVANRYWVFAKAHSAPADPTSAKPE